MQIFARISKHDGDGPDAKIAFVSPIRIVVSRPTRVPSATFADKSRGRARVSLAVSAISKKEESFACAAA